MNATKRVTQFIQRLDEIEAEIRAPTSMQLSAIHAWCQKVLSYEEKINIMKQHVFQVDLDYFEERIRTYGNSYVDRFNRELALQQEAEERFIRFCMFIDEVIHQVKAYLVDFEKSLADVQCIKQQLQQMSEMHWLQAAL
ncbi:hypothetical protein [Enterococcus sp. DIV1420a]|uniref:hypothetical protein n=1 Tax=Enterococcus sp. DIV1420a TaxID=2774672 RepID=UPI00128A994D|nr:hypothetical protein [Listeria monocytogenes]